MNIKVPGWLRGFGKKGDNLSSTAARITLVLSAVLVYTLALVNLYPAEGPGSIALSLLPVCIAAWLFGMRGGMILGVLAFPFNALIITMVWGSGWELVTQRGLTGSLSLVMVGIAIGKLREYDLRAKQRAKELSSMLEVARAVSSSLEIEEVLSRVANHMGRAINATSVYIINYDPNRPDSPVVAKYFSPGAYGLEQVSELCQPIHERMIGYLEAGEPHQIYADDPGLGSDVRAQMRRCGVFSSLILPMRFHGQTIGYAVLRESRKRRVFTPDEISLCQNISQQVTVAIENARLYEQAQRELTEREKAEEHLKRSKEFAETVLNAMQDAISIVDVHDYRIVGVNSTFLREYKTTAEELLNRTCYQVTHHLNEPCSLPDDFCPLADAKRTKRPVIAEHIHYDKEGNQKYVEISAYPIFDENGGVIQIVHAARDITARKRAVMALRESKERYALVAHGANDGLWDWDLKTDKVYFSPRWKGTLGYEEGDIGSDKSEWFDRVHPEDAASVELAITHYLAGNTSHFQHEHRLLHKDGSYRWVLARGVAIRDENGIAYRLAGSQTDITERKRAEEQMRYDALHDALTGLPNRTLFLDRLGRALERAKRNADNKFALLFLDLDRFKLVNDGFGHLVGDKLLCDLAHRLEKCVRAVDTAARFGGDEFAILLEGVDDLSEATVVADRIQEQLKQPFRLDNQEVFVSASIGIVSSGLNYERPEEILRDADIAMYRAKAQGKARYTIFGAEMRSDSIERLKVEAELRRALEKQELQVYYQPIMHLKTGRLTGYEALVRWQHPDKGLVLPTEFIAIAEETGLIIPIDWWVLREACQQMRNWQARFPLDPPLTLSVNLSSKHFYQFDLVKQVEDNLRNTGLNPGCLRLEITESAVMENMESAVVILEQLQKLGVQVHIDDFGTGYSSLSQLYQFPVNAIKIDRSFISNIDVPGKLPGIIRSIVRLAADLGLEAVAEGVETLDQLKHLEALACTFGQGYYFGRPMDATAAEAFMAQEMLVR